MGQICSLFGITRQAYYQQQKRETLRSIEKETILESVRQVRRHHPRMGCRKILDEIQPLLAWKNIKMGRDQLFDLLREADLLVKPKKKYRRTTFSGRWRAPNRLPGMTISQSDQVWVCDITYLALTNNRFAYLFLIMDLYSRCIIGWHVAPSLETTGALASLEMALAHRLNKQREGIHHSDHGVQYTSQAYLQKLQENRLLASMGAVGNCYDNIYAERVIGTLKGEYNLDADFTNVRQVSATVKEVVYLYNTERPHLSLGMAKPQDVYIGNIVSVPSIDVPLAG
jgi:putative transposase